MDKSTRRSVAKLLITLMTGFMLVSASGAYAQSSGGGGLQGIGIDGGKDQSGNLGAVNDLGQTVIGFIVNVVAKVIGVAIAMWGITDFVKREVLWGTVKIFLCGACFFLNKIIVAMSHISTASGG